MDQRFQYLDPKNDDVILRTVLRKSLSTAVGQVLLVGLCLVSTLYARHFDRLLLLTFAFQLVVTSIRVSWGIRTHQNPDRVVVGKFYFRLITGASGFGWGLLLAECLALYGFQDQSTFVLVTVLAGACATATYSLSPAVIASRRFILFALGLPILALLFALPQSHIVEAVVFFSFWAYLRNQIEIQSRQFWRAKYQEQHLLALDRYTLEAILIHDQGRLLQVNSAFCRMFGVRPEDVATIDVRTIVHPVDRSDDPNWQGFTLDVPRQWRAVRTNGEEFAAESISRITKFRGRDVRVVCVTDITLRREAERALEESDRVIKESLLQREQAALESSKLKAEFLANMSHEIRTPLNAIIGITDLLKTDSPSAQHQKYYATMKASGELLLTIINDVLDFSKIDAGKIEIEKLPFNLANIVQAQAGMMSHRALEKHLSFQTRIDANLPFRVEGDPNRISQVLVNLLSNAVKFTERGEVLLRVFATPERADHVTFEVTDTGIGIRDSDLRKLFSPFTQADTSTARRFGGTGLGLSISKRLVELMGGELRVTSDEGVGSRFWFDLPLAEIASPVDTPVKIMATSPVSAGGHVLLAEDNAVNRMIALAMLEAAGYTSTAVANGHEALEELKRNHYDIVLMDCQMPEMDGFEATRAIRELERQTGRHIPIIALTANATIEDKNLCFASGMDDFMAKPVHQEKFATVLLKWSKPGLKNEESARVS